VEDDNKEGNDKKRRYLLLKKTEKITGKRGKKNK
jgi:hypothetical protein